MDERELVQKLNERSPEAMEAMQTRYGPLMRYIIGGILPEGPEREECFNDVSLQVWENISAFDPAKSHFTTWLTAVTRNAALNRLRALQRRQGREEELAETIPDPAPGPEELVLRQERTERLREAIAQLSPAEQTLFYRKYYYLQSTAQIAAETGLTSRGVEGRLRRLRLKLRKLLGGEQP